MFDACVNLHSEQFSADPWAVVERGFESGLTGMGLTGSCLESTLLAIDLAHKRPNQLCATVGLHPHSAKDWSLSLLDTFETLAADSHGQTPVAALWAPTAQYAVVLR